MTLSSGTLASNITVQSGSSDNVLDSSNTSGTVGFTGNVTLNQNVFVSSAAGGTLSFNTGGISGNGSVTVYGWGVVVLAGVETYSGATTINPGSTLNVTGSITSNVIVNWRQPR